MAAIVQKLQCAQLPEVIVLGIGNGSKLDYLLHTQKLIGLSLHKIPRGTANAAMHSFLKSEAGRSMQHGGDLMTAFGQGPLTAQIYTHQLGVTASKPSHFVTIEGARTILETLPNQDDSVKQRLLTLLQDHLLDQAKATACFEPASDDRMMIDEEDMCTEDNGAMPMAPPMMYRIFAAENQSLVAQLKAKDEVLQAKDKVLQAKEDVIQAKSAEAKAHLTAKDEVLQAKDKVLQAKDEVLQAKSAEAKAQLKAKEEELAKERAEHAKETAAKDAKILELQYKAKDDEIAQLKLQLKAAKASPKVGEKRPAPVSFSQSSFQPQTYATNTSSLRYPPLTYMAADVPFRYPPQAYSSQSSFQQASPVSTYKSPKTPASKTSSTYENTDRAFVADVQSFVTENVLPAAVSEKIVATKDIMELFQARKGLGNHQPMEFVKTLAKVMQDLVPSSKKTRTKTIRGYRGISLKKD